MSGADTIAAIATPPGEGALAVIRISGADAVAIAEKVFRGSRRPGAVRARTATFGRVEDAEGRLVDEVVLTVYRAPASYTGEDVVEISGHGGVLVAARILELALAAGARGAEPGEFTQRAFLNGKLDLTQAEAVMDLIRAQTPLALRAAAEQLEGRIGSEVEQIRSELVGVVVQVEAHIDFPEEGIEPETGAALARRLDGILGRVRALLDTADEGRILREGVRLAICGRPNAGKSSLLNRLVGFDRVIVSPTPGTTRDTIDEFINLGGIAFRVTDTAGLRETHDAVESEGVARARHAIEAADLVLRVIDATDPAAAADGRVRDDEIAVLNKIDRLDPDDGRTAAIADASPAAAHGTATRFRISCQTGAGIPALVEALVARVRRPGAARRESLAAINARHKACLDRAARALGAARDGVARQIEPELAAVELRLALDAIGEVVGRIDAETILGEIFSTFCIGK